MNTELDAYLDILIEKHLPINFIDYDVILQAKQHFTARNDIGRKETLILAYLIGADSKEANNLLRILGHPTLYVKCREDAMWKYILDRHMDSASLIESIFQQTAEPSD